ncbi:uncharacterized protein LOC131012633 isoform X1 [Salvia miltiorrhiza]|nr:uncharacterized protein LOC131012633 isoform X1 [Salvia miltiorrhiza]
MTNAYLVEEATAFCSYYFEEHVRTKQRNVPRNFAGSSSSGGMEEHHDTLFVFKNVGRGFGKKSTRFLSKDEYDAAHLYVLNNCSEITEIYTRLFVDEINAKYPNISPNQLQIKLNKEFPDWFKLYVADPNNRVENSDLKSLSLKPFQRVTSFQGFYVNGFKFHTIEYGSKKSTYNSGLCVKGLELDYYGRLVEVVVLEYSGVPTKTITLFKCEWFDPRPSGTLVDRDFKLVSINQRRRYDNYEPFILSTQASQVFYCTYPSKNQSRKDWLAACKVKARPLVEVSTIQNIPIDPTPFQEELVGRTPHTTIDDDTMPIHPDGALVYLVDEDDEEDVDTNEYVLETSDSTNNDSDDSE